jgi:hypothetical protein
MRDWRRWWLVGAFVLSCLPGAAWADSEVDVLLNKLVEKGVLSNVDAGLIRREISETKEARNKELAKEIVPDSARNWKWKGDIRLRNEYRNQTGTGNNVNRQRIRFRYGFDAKVADTLKVGARLATGSADDPVSTNQTFGGTATSGGSFLKKNIFLDLAYARWTPQIPGVSQVEFNGGIIENPFWTVSPLVWDGDLSFDGAAVRLAQELGPVTLFTNNGLFAIDSDESEAAALWSTQGGASMAPFADAEEAVLKNLKLTGAVAYYDYSNVGKSAIAGTDIVAKKSTNSSTLEDLNLLNPSVELATSFNDIPMSLYGDWVRNIATNVGEDKDGFQLGVKVGKAKTPWSLKSGWEAGYFWQRLEKDATFDEFTDSDFNGGGTNNKGHAFYVTLAVLKNSTAGVKYLTGREINGSKNAIDTFQMDWVTKF